MVTVYRGEIANVKVVQMSFKLHEKNKQIKFFKRLKLFVDSFL